MPKKPPKKLPGIENLRINNFIKYIEQNIRIGDKHLN